MVRRIVVFFCLLACLVIGHLALAQEFSADVVNSKSKNADLTRVYAGKNKLRYEGVDQGSPMGAVAVIFDETQHRYLVLMAEKHMYMDAPFTMVKPMITQFWHVDDVNDACPGWKKAAEQLGTDKNWGSCTKIGSDSLNGRSAVKYEGVSNEGEKNYVWVDSKLQYVVKMEDTHRTVELRNIREGSQPASLFEIPAGYTKFDMGAMMKQRQ